MTNIMIIFTESCRLYDEGIIGGTGELVTVERPDGTKEQVEMPEEIHTYKGWKERGYQVQKGEKSIAQFPIWTYRTKKKKSEDDEEKGKMFLKTAFFFKGSQVQPIA